MDMVNIMLHVTDLLRFKKCPSLCWNSTNRSIHTENFYKMDVPFSDLWKDYLKLDEYGQGHSMDSNEMTLKLLDEHENVLFARFEYKECRTKIPCLKRIEGGYCAIYPYLNAYPKEYEAVHMKIDQMIAESVGIKIIEHKIIFLNKEYVRSEILDIDQLFLSSYCLFNKRNHLSKKIDDCIHELDFDLDSWINETKECMGLNQIEPIRTKKCTAGRRCLYYTTCFNEENEPDDSILFFTTSKNKLEEYKKGKRKIKDLDVNLMDGFRLQYAQYMASKNGNSFIDKAALNVWLQDIQYPISYLDFEWDTFAVPPYSGMKPFDVLCFQYSLHIENECSELKHYNFFGTKDCRIEFIESLIKNLPKTGTILVYNMEGAEKLRLLQLADQFEEYREDLENICYRMMDLSKPFECGLFYDNKMRGHYSLKSILPVFTKKVSYQDLDIQNGMSAVYAYRTYDSIDENEKKNIQDSISKYCALDTYSEYIVYHGLLEEVKKCQI